jgi:periplasmic divalent cation tolerance protein
MIAAHRYSLVLVTAPNLSTARKLVRLALQARLVACGNLVPRLESHYWWQGKIEKSAEVLILFKTTAAALPRLEKLILDQHPYDTPEIITLPLTKGTARYLKWISASVPG